MRDYPLDIRGLILRHIYPDLECRWIAPFLWQEQLDVRSHVACDRLARRYEILIEVDCLGHGRIIPRAAGIAARQGRITLANLFMTTHLYGRQPEPELEARALSLLNDEKRKIRRLLNRNREWPQDVWNLQDTPAWIIPSFIRRFRTLVNSRAVSIISGGHLLAEGNWLWEFESKSHIASQIRAHEITSSG
jgi:hypothetical protein|tara:strand:- start:4362 stop:4934 length:573 start_codon:yes stop_codon:yes gene_type:complete